MDRQIDTVMKRGRGYWFVDGFTEIIAGGLFILLGGILLLRGIAPQHSFLAQFVSVASDISIVKAIGIVAAILVLWWLKNQFTYPRTGFVREKWVTLTQMLTFIGKAILILILPVLGLVAAFILLPSVRGVLFSMPVWFPAGLGLVWAVLCVLSGEWMGLRRFRLMGALILLAGIIIGVWQLVIGLPNFPVEALQSNSLAALPEVVRASMAETINRTFISICLLTLVSGLVFAVSGVVTFLRYRKENPVPYREEA
jgi:hypothetical protein